MGSPHPPPPPTPPPGHVPRQGVPRFGASPRTPLTPQTPPGQQGPRGPGCFVNPVRATQVLSQKRAGVAGVSPSAPRSVRGAARGVIAPPPLGEIGGLRPRVSLSFMLPLVALSLGWGWCPSAHSIHHFTQEGRKQKGEMIAHHWPRPLQGMAGPLALNRLLSAHYFY